MASFALGTQSLEGAPQGKPLAEGPLGITFPILRREAKPTGHTAFPASLCLSVTLLVTTNLKTGTKTTPKTK